MAKAKTETVEQSTLTTEELTVENLQKLLNEQKDEYKKLEEEKVSLVAKLQHLGEQEEKIKELDEQLANSHTTIDKLKIH